MTETQTAEVEVKLYLCGFPKSGTHLLNSMALALANPNYQRNWCTSFKRGGWSNEWGEIPTICSVLEKIPPGAFLKGHLGYRTEFLDTLQNQHVCVIFIYRDPRDVAVSQAFHILSDQHERYTHPDRDRYLELGNFNSVLSAVINGIPDYPGVMDRWEMYAPWLEQDGILKLRYEEVIQYPLESARLFVRFVYGRSAKYLGYKVTLNKADFDKVVSAVLENMLDREGSPTFRKGVSGEWRSYFTAQHRAEFKASDKNNWLIRLKYENHKEW